MHHSALLLWQHSYSHDEPCVSTNRSINRNGFILDLTLWIMTVVMTSFGACGWHLPHTARMWQNYLVCNGNVEIVPQMENLLKIPYSYSRPNRASNSPLISLPAHSFQMYYMYLYGNRCLESSAYVIVKRWKMHSVKVWKWIYHSVVGARKYKSSTYQL